MTSLLLLFSLTAPALATPPVAEPCTTLPSRPTALSVTVSGSTVTLTWLAAYGCTPASYVITAGSTPGAANIVVFPTGNSATTFTVSAVPTGLYYVSVLAESAAGRSAPSNEVIVAVGVPCTVPPAPAGLAATATSTTGTLTWVAGSPGTTSYILEAGSADGLSNLVVVDTGSAATTFTAAAPAGIYYVRVRARNACGVGPASNEAMVAIAPPTPLPSPGNPLELRGNQVVVVSGSYAFHNRIDLYDNSTLIIRNATFNHVTAYAGQYELWAYDDAKVIIENSTINSSVYVSWRFFGRARLQMTNVVNNQSTLWHGFLEHAKASFVHVSRAYCTGADGADIQIYDVADAFVEMVFPVGSTVDEGFPRAVEGQAYRFPSSNDSGVTHTLSMALVPFARWGITYHPQSQITIRDTRALVVTFNIPRTFSGVTARFDGLRATLYADQTWTTGNSVLRLINTVTEPWSPIVSGNNTLIITDSELADIAGIYDSATVHIADSTLSQVRARDQSRFWLERSYVSGDIVASNESVITLTDVGLGGQIVREQNGQVIINRVLTASPGFVLRHQASLTARAGEVIAGRASVKGVSSGASRFNPFIETDRRVLALTPHRTYRATFKYRILQPASEHFELVFGSPTAFAAGVFLQNLTITGAAGESGTATLINTLAAYDDYVVSWLIVGSGAIVIDDIVIVDVATGAVVAAESAETVLSGSPSLHRAR
jgi:hypothetical protein